MRTSEFLSQSRFPLERRYFPVLETYSPEFPEFLAPFLTSPTLERLSKISQACGTEFTKLYDHKLVLSRLDHSLGVALIVWHFTKDPAATLAGLFHDVSHSVFSHVGDYLLWDAETQEASEGLAENPLLTDPVVISGLAKLGIPMESVIDYSIYPIADNPGPRLAADRLEYTLGTPIVYGTRDLEWVAGLYEKIEVLKNEDGLPEIGFSDFASAETLALLSIENDSTVFSSAKSNLPMAYLAGLVGRAVSAGVFSLNDLYRIADEEIVAYFESGKDLSLKEDWGFYRSISRLEISAEKLEGTRYCVSVPTKKRYIDPLFVSGDNGVMRVSKVSEKFRIRRDAHLVKKIEWISAFAD